MPALGRTLRLLLPREHGAWSLAFEPLALGLLAAPSRAGAGLALAAAAAFLARHPLQALLRADAPARRAETARLLLGPGLAAAICLGVSATLGSVTALWPLLLAVPPAVLFIACDVQGETRAAAAELAGAATFAVLPAAFATLAGRDSPAALALAAAMLLRAVPSVLVIRAFLRRSKGSAGAAWPALAASTAAAVLLAALTFCDQIGVAALGAALLLLVRAGWLLGPSAPALHARQLGTLEAALGAGFVLAVALA